MVERVEKLSELTMNGKMYVNSVKTEYDEKDMELSRLEYEPKRLYEYILNQEPKITEYSLMTGFVNFDGSCVGDSFNRKGHIYNERVKRMFYLKPVGNLSTMEWQHATADYSKLLKTGISGMIEEINHSLKVHTTEEEQGFLKGMKTAAEAVIGWAHKCSKRAAEFAETVKNEEYRQNLLRLSEALLCVPENVPRNFYEAVLSIYICFMADPDSLGTLDRFLYPFYIADDNLTDEDAKAYLQELFLMIQAKTPINSGNFSRGGESHFCVGGYLPDGTDGFNELSKLIVDALMELPVYCPQITLRWTSKTPREVLYYMMDRERNDIRKRIAFTNDEKRIKCYTEICKIPFEKAVNYTTLGCNEPAFMGAVFGATSYCNIVKFLEDLFHKYGHKIENAETFEEFYAVFQSMLFSDLAKAFEYDDFYNSERAKDYAYLTSLFFNDCAENAKSFTKGGGKTAVASLSFIGITNVIDSLVTVKQFVFDEKLITMRELTDALKANWKGYEELRTLILKEGVFFGNDDERSNSMGQRLYNSFYSFMKDKTNLFGYHWLVGDLTGYNPHHEWFGNGTKATPDGRMTGDALKFGIGQSEGRDKEGLTALLNSIAKLDPHAIGCGSTVTNIMVEENLIRNDESFKRMVALFETYFEQGGVHFQLTYVSREDLLKAKKTPEEYGHIRVRVSGFSDYFVNLSNELQDEVIRRTGKKV